MPADAVMALFARLEHEQHAAREVEPRVFGHLERIHVAAEQHRGPGRIAFQRRRDAAGRLVERHVERQASERRQDCLTGVARIVHGLTVLQINSSGFVGSAPTVRMSGHTGRFASTETSTP